MIATQLDAPTGVKSGDTTRHVTAAHLPKTRRSDHCRERLLVWETPNALHEILISITIVRDLFTKPRDDLKRIGVIERLEFPPLKRGKFETEEAPSWL